LRKISALLLILVFTVSSLIVVSLGYASAAMPKPSVPEFTVKLIDSSYDVPTTYSIDPYTGENVTHPGHRVENRTIAVTIKNQPFVPFYDVSSGWNISFYYGVRVKGHYVENWTELYLVEDVPTQSYSEYTVLSYALSGEDTYILGDKMMEFPPGAQVDFQVEAMIGYVHRVFNPNATNQLEMYPYYFTGETSGWSETRTITIPTSISSPPDQTPTSTPDQEPQQTELLQIILAVALIATVVGVGLGLLVYFKKRNRGRNS
jgi:hypothetical protein